MLISSICGDEKMREGSHERMSEGRVSVCKAMTIGIDQLMGERTRGRKEERSSRLRG